MLTFLSKAIKVQTIFLHLLLGFDSNSGLKEYYEFFNEARTLSGFFPTDADLFTAMQLIMKLF